MFSERSNGAVQTFARAPALWTKGHPSRSGPLGRSALLVFALLSQSPSALELENPGARTPDTTPPESLKHVVRLSPESERLAQIKTFQPEPSLQHPEFPCFGRVLDVKDLLTLRNRHRETEANLELRNASLALSGKNLSRIRSLHTAKVVPERELIQAESEWRANQTQQRAAQLEEESIREEIIYLWGDVVSRMILDKDPNRLEQLIRHEKALIQLTLPRGRKASRDQSRFFVSRHPSRSEAIPAEILSPAPRTDDLLQGESWLLEIPGAHYQPGMRIHAWVLSEDLIEGVEVPSSAILWQGGRPWIFLQEGPGVYRRIPVDLVRENHGKPLITSPIEAQAPIVILGAQALLSEEFHERIPAEDDQRD